MKSPASLNHGGVIDWSAPAGPGAPKPRPRVLVVDDDPILLGLELQILEYGGYEVEGAANGLEALASIERQEFDVVLTDCLMPGLDGIGLLTALRRSGNRVPVVLTSGSFSSVPLSPAIVGEVAVILKKPAGASALLDAIKSALRTRNL
jgi:CheY-like chemotaxis protein